MDVVSNSSPLIALYSIYRLELLRELYGEVYIPRAVYLETVIQAKYKGQAHAIGQAKWIKIDSVKNQKAVTELMATAKLQAGEAEAICLSLDRQSDLIVLDEQDGRNCARQQGLNLTGTFGILLDAKKKKLISKIKPDIDKLKTLGFRISQELYKEILKKAKEN